jgi:hypothetical protein
MRYNINTRDDFASGYMTKAHGGASMTKSIPLTQGKFAIVDDGDYEYLNQWKWYATLDHHTHTYYAMRREYPSRKSIMMHREIMNPPDGLIVDHIHHDTLDNRRSELRIVTYSQNSRNKNKEIKGFSKRGNKYQVSISFTENGKRHNIYIGVYATEEATEVYKEEIKKYI